MLLHIPPVPKCQWCISTHPVHKNTKLRQDRHTLKPAKTFLTQSTNLWHCKLKLITSPLLLPLQELYTKCTLVNSSFVNIKGIWSNTSVQQNATTPTVIHMWTEIWLWWWQRTIISLNLRRVYSSLNSINVLINLQLMIGHMPQIWPLVWEFI